jgi:hypothetical protein
MVWSARLADADGPLLRVRAMDLTLRSIRCGARRKAAESAPHDALGRLGGTRPSREYGLDGIPPGFVTESDTVTFSSYAAPSIYLYEYSNICR